MVLKLSKPSKDHPVQTGLPARPPGTSPTARAARCTCQVRLGHSACAYGHGYFVAATCYVSQEASRIPPRPARRPGPVRLTVESSDPPASEILNAKIQSGIGILCILSQTGHSAISSAKTLSVNLKVVDQISGQFMPRPGVSAGHAPFCIGSDCLDRPAQGRPVDLGRRVLMSGVMGEQAARWTLAAQHLRDQYPTTDRAVAPV